MHLGEKKFLKQSLIGVHSTVHQQMNHNKAGFFFSSIACSECSQSSSTKAESLKKKKNQMVMIYLDRQYSTNPSGTNRLEKLHPSTFLSSFLSSDTKTLLRFSAGTCETEQI